MSNTYRRVLVTGATGFIGRTLVAELVEAGHQVTCAVREKSIAPDMPRRAADAFATAQKIVISSWENLEEQSGPFDQVFHLAAAGTNPGDRDVGSLIRLNSLAGAAIVQAAHCWGASVVAAGTCSEYADPADAKPLKENAPLQASRLYGTTKAAGTLLELALGQALNVPVVVCRLFNVFGVGEADHRLFPTLLRGLSRGEFVDLSLGTQIRDMLWSRDVVEALIAAGNYLVGAGSPTQTVINICSGKGISIRSFAERVCDCLGADRQLLRFGSVPLRPDDISAMVGDSERAFSLIGWRAQHGALNRIPYAVDEYLYEQR